MRRLTEVGWGLVSYITGDPKIYGCVYIGIHGRVFFMEMEKIGIGIFC